MIMLYRYIKAKRARKAQAAASGDPAHSTQPVQPVGPDDEVPTPQATPQMNKSEDTMSVKWRIMLMIALAIPVFLETLDYTVVATAQVHIASVFNRLDLQSYVGTIYLLTSTVFLPPFASVADIFGRHWALQIGLLFFLVGSAISTGSENMPTMLAGRGVAGIGAAGLLAVVRIILTDSGSLQNVTWQQLVLFGLYTIGYCVGPFIGGELITVSFRWIFAINLPCAAVAMALSFLLLRGRTKGPQLSSRHGITDSVYPTSKFQGFLDKLLRIDWIGAFLFMASGILLLLALNWGSTEKWDSAKVIACFVVGGVLMILTIAWEYYLERQAENALRTSSGMRLLNVDPMIPLDVFRNRNICIVQFGTFVNGMVMLVMFYFVAIFFVIVVGKSASQSGVQLIYFAPGLGGGSLLAMNILKLTKQPKYCIMLGSIVSTVALGLISMGMDQNKEGSVNGFMVMAGVGTGLSIGPLAVQARFSQPVERNAVVSALTLFVRTTWIEGTKSALINLSFLPQFRSFGGTVGLAQCGAVLNGKVNSYITNLIKSGAITGDEASAIASMSSSSSLSSLDNIDSLPTEIQTIVRDAFRQGSRFAFISLIPWAALAAITALFLTSIREDQRTNNQTSSDATQAAGMSREEVKLEEIKRSPNLEEVRYTSA
ncbi:hypothetical protein EIP86_003344 [Pleurotus ostreatoroseus]|nr:hypothetical protein EIP86_003344 [Pleurotus ostreatoroseus]